MHSVVYSVLKKLSKTKEMVRTYIFSKQESVCSSAALLTQLLCPRAQLYLRSKLLVGHFDDLVKGKMTPNDRNYSQLRGSNRVVGCFWRIYKRLAFHCLLKFFYCYRPPNWSIGVFSNLESFIEVRWVRMGRVIWWFGKRNFLFLNTINFIIQVIKVNLIHVDIIIWHISYIHSGIHRKKVSSQKKIPTVNYKTFKLNLKKIIKPIRRCALLTTIFSLINSMYTFYIIYFH